MAEEMADADLTDVARTEQRRRNGEKMRAMQAEITREQLRYFASLADEPDSVKGGTMSEKIEPAMAPEQWAEMRYEEHGHGRQEPTFVAWVGDDFTGTGYFATHTDAPESQARPTQAGRHALAALALHGQPFGFTREDEALVREMEGSEWDRLPPEMYREYAQRIRSLATRIAALLPPES